MKARILKDSMLLAMVCISSSAMAEVGTRDTASTLIFDCRTPPNHDASIQVLVYETDVHGYYNLGYVVNDKLTNIGAEGPTNLEESMISEFQGFNADLSINFEPDMNPIAGKVYLGRWNGVQDLNCTAK